MSYTWCDSYIGSLNLLSEEKVNIDTRRHIPKISTVQTKFRRYGSTEEN